MPGNGGGKRGSGYHSGAVQCGIHGPDGTPASRKNVTASAESVEVTVPVRQVVSLPLTVEIIEAAALPGRMWR